MEQNEFDNLIAEIDPTNMIPYIIDKMVHKPELLTGFKKINTFSLRMYASFGQANNIKYGTVLEKYFNKYLEELGWEILDRDYTLTNEEKIKYQNDSNRVNVDLVAKYDDTVIFIEQKILDNHDSTKKTGQLRNFQEKATVIQRNYPNNDIYGFEWFIDDSQVKNGSNWQIHNEEFEIDHPEYKDKLFVVYGKELEDKLTTITKVNHSEMLNSFDAFMKNWHLSHGRELPAIEFDRYPIDVVDCLKQHSYKKVYDMFTNEDLIEQIHPIIFPNNQVYKAYLRYLEGLDTKTLRKDQLTYRNELIKELNSKIQENS